MIIDAHIHLGVIAGVWHVKARTVDQVIERMDKAAITVAIASHLESLGYDFLEGNARLYEAWRRFPDRLVPLVAVNPRFAEEARSEIRKYLGEHRWPGAKLHPQQGNYPVNCYATYKLFEEIERYGSFALIHSGDKFVAANSSPYAIAEVAKRFPGTKIVMAHMGVWDWQDAIEVAGMYPNVLLDTSGSGNTYGMIEQAVEELGPERVLYGSDFPLMPFEPLVAKVTGCELPDDIKAMLLHENAERLLAEHNWSLPVSGASQA